MQYALLHAASIPCAKRVALGYCGLPLPLPTAVGHAHKTQELYPSVVILRERWVGAVLAGDSAEVQCVRELGLLRTQSAYSG